MTMLTRSSSNAKYFSFLVILLALAGCANKEAAPPSEGRAHASAASAAVPGGGEIGTATALPAAARSLVVTMNVSITVDRVDTAMTRINASVQQAGGYVADQNTSGSGSESEGNQRASVQLRVPADKVAGVRSSLGELGEVTSSNEKVEDVTQERADIEARLHSARIQEKRILDVLEKKATEIHELVEAEKELARIRENIERLEAQDRVMKSQIALATIHINLEAKSTPAWQTPGPSLVRAGKVGVRGAAAIAVYSGMAICTVAPTVVPIAALLLAILMVVRRRRNALLAGANAG